MRFVIATFFCLICVTSPVQVVETQEQSGRFKVQMHSAYMRDFTVGEASDNNVQPIGIRLMASDYDHLLWEVGVNAYANYGDVAHASLGFNLAYLFAERKSHDFKIGLSLSKIDLEDAEVDEDVFDPQVGDLSFEDFSNEFKPYIEWEWIFSRYSSLFIQSGYRFINGEKTVITSVEQDDVGGLIIESDENFFYSASGFEIGVGLSIIF